MPSPVRLTHQSLRILRVFLDTMSGNIHAELAGTDVMTATHFLSGTVYPILLRFEDAGILESRWEKESPAALGRPRRRFYRLTPAGIKTAQKALDDLSSPVKRLRPAHRPA